MLSEQQRCNPACAHATCVPCQVRLPHNRLPTPFDCQCAAILTKTGSLAEANNTSTIIVYGPPGCGKTTHADAIAEFFGKPVIVDEWCPGEALPANSIAFTNAANAVAFADVIKLVGRPR